MLIGSPCSSTGTRHGGEEQTPDRPPARRQTAPTGERRGRRRHRRPRSGPRSRPRSSRTGNGSTLTTLWPWLAHPASASRLGSLAPSARRPVATIDPFSIIAGRSSARTWRSPEAMDVIRALSNPSAAPICSFSTTSALNPSTPAPVMTCWKSSRSDTGADPRSSPLELPLSAWHDVVGDPNLRGRHPGPPPPQRSSHRVDRREPPPRSRQAVQNGLTRTPVTRKNFQGLNKREPPRRDHLVTTGRHHPGIPGSDHPVIDGRLRRNQHPPPPPPPPPPLGSARCARTLSVVVTSEGY